MIKLTKTNGNPVYLNKNAISAVTTKDGATAVFVVGDMSPFEVKEPIKHIVELIESNQ